MDIEKIEKAFDKYVSKFNFKNDRINLKYHHTYRVAKQSRNIAISLGLDEENVNLAYLIGMLHDIGRFEQAKKYNTFNDFISVDHADYGCKLLFEDGLIRKFIKDDKYDDIIYNSIHYHNKYEIGNNLDEDTLLHAMIIRDADKIDIIHNVADTGKISLPEDEFGVSMLVAEDFCYERPVNHSHKYTKNDSTLTMIAFVFDLNFDFFT